jgi:hypothetical protein
MTGVGERARAFGIVRGVCDTSTGQQEEETWARLVWPPTRRNIGPGFVNSPTSR